MPPVRSTVKNCQFFMIVWSVLLKGAYRNSCTLDTRLGRWALDAGLWTLDSGRWTLEVELWTLDSEPWTLNSGSWTMDTELWTLDAGLRELDTIFDCFRTKSAASF